MAEAITETTSTGGHGLGKVVRLDDSSPSSPYKRVAEKLDGAERLLLHAAETGIKIDDDVREAVLNARATVADKWDKQTAAAVLWALTSLSQKLTPVTAENLTKWSDKAFKRHMSFYKWVAMCLTPIIVVFSLVTFITSGISKAIDADITRGNELAVKLGDQIRAKDDNKQTKIVPHDLQEFAVIIRAIAARAQQLNRFIFNAVSIDLREDKNVQIKPGEADNPEEAIKLIGSYQGVRSAADRVKEYSTIFYGAMGSCILPVLYALLGTCAYLLRSIPMEHSRFIAYAHYAYLVTAVIGGAVVGLFPNFSINQTPAISPLAIAFLVGYGIDVFFSFLDSLLQTFTRRGNPVPGAKATV